MEEVQKQLETKQAELEDLQKKYDTLKEEFDEFQEICRDLEKESAAELKHSEEEVKKLQARLSTDSKEKQTLLDRLAKAAEGNAEIDRLNQELEKWKGTVADLRAKIADLETQNDEYSQREREACAQNELLQQKLDEALERFDPFRCSVLVLPCSLAHSLTHQLTHPLFPPLHAISHTPHAIEHSSHELPQNREALSHEEHEELVRGSAEAEQRLCEENKDLLEEIAALRSTREQPHTDPKRTLLRAILTQSVPCAARC
eukprot:1151369-Rhodomonas_salina.5